MPYPEELVGKFFHWPNAPVPHTATTAERNGLNQHLLENAVIQCNFTVYRQHASRVGAMPVSVSPPAWTFKFLRYIAGVTTVTDLNQDVMTGPMSGCVLVRYQGAAATRIAHIGTANAPESAESVNAKTDFLNFTQTPGVAFTQAQAVQIKDEVFTGAEWAQVHAFHSRKPGIFGYYKPGGASALLLTPIADRDSPLTPQANTWKVVACKPLTLRQWELFAAERIFTRVGEPEVKGGFKL